MKSSNLLLLILLKTFFNISNGSCVSLHLGYHGCCNNLLRFKCSDNGCYCDRLCYIQGDCCSDIASIGCHLVDSTTVSYTPTTSVIASLTTNTKPIPTVSVGKFTTTTPTTSVIASLTTNTKPIPTVVVGKFTTTTPTTSLVTALTTSTPIPAFIAGKFTTTISHTPTTSLVTALTTSTPIPAGNDSCDIAVLATGIVCIVSAALIVSVIVVFLSLRKKCSRRSTYSLLSQSISFTSLISNKEENIYVNTGTEGEDQLSNEITVNNDHNIDGQEDTRKEIV